MNFLGAVLGIKVSLSGMTQVINGIQSLGGQLGLTQNQIGLVSQGFKILSAEAAVMALALVKAGSDETMRLSLSAILHSGSMAVDQMRLIRAESEKGLFGKSDVFEAIKRFDLAHQSISDLLPLTEELAARSGQSLGAVSKYISEIAGGGSARLQAFFKAAGVTVRDLRAAGLSVSDHYQIGNSPTQILTALKTIASQNSLTGALGGGWEATIGGLTASMNELWRSIGDGLLPVFKPLVSLVTTLVQWITWLNDQTHGLLSDFILLSIAFRAISLILPLFRLGLIPSIASVGRLALAANAAAAALWRIAGSPSGSPGNNVPIPGGGPGGGGFRFNWYLSQIGPWFSNLWTKIAPFGRILGLVAGWLGRVALAAGLFLTAIYGIWKLIEGIGNLIRPGTFSGENTIDSNIARRWKDYSDNGWDSNWWMQEGDPRKNPPPAERPVRRSDPENVIYRTMGRNYA